MSPGSSTSAGRADAGAPDHAPIPLRRPGPLDNIDLFALRLVEQRRAGRAGNGSDSTFLLCGKPAKAPA